MTSRDDPTVSVHITCQLCGGSDSVLVSSSAWTKYAEGVPPQSAFKGVLPKHLGMLASDTCARCWLEQLCAEALGPETP